MKKLIPVGALLVLALLVGVGTTWYYRSADIQDAPKSGGVDLGVCQVTEATTSIGNQASTLLLATSSSRQWAVIQQPQNATNTVTLSLGGGAAVAGRGYQLTPATSTSPKEEWTIGFATAFRTQNPVRAITGSGSTTIKVIDCR